MRNVLLLYILYILYTPCRKCVGSTYSSAICSSRCTYYTKSREHYLLHKGIHVHMCIYVCSIYLSLSHLSSLPHLIAFTFFSFYLSCSLFYFSPALYSAISLTVFLSLMHVFSIIRAAQMLLRLQLATATWLPIFLWLVTLKTPLRHFLL